MLDLSLVLQFCFSGLAIGCIYGMVGIGFNIIYNTTGIINFAQGEFVMLGGMIVVTLTQLGEIPIWLAIPLTILFVAAIGGLIELLFIRPNKDQSVLKMIIITIGLSIIIREIALHIWDEKMRTLAPFTGDVTTSLSVFGAYIKPQTLWIFGILIITVIFLAAFFKKTRIGKAMRATSDNKEGALLVGVDVRRMILFSFIISAALGALAGIVMTPQTSMMYNKGAELAIKGFAASILGGLGNSYGSVIGGLIIGLLESFSVGLGFSGYENAISLFLLILMLVIKPSGILGSTARSKLKEF